MTKTEQQLLEIHKAPFVRLADICALYLNCNYAWARQKAALHTLPFPAFQMSDDSQKSPWVVHITDLAAYLDERTRLGRAAWTRSQT